MNTSTDTITQLVFFGQSEGTFALELLPQIHRSLPEILKFSDAEWERFQDLTRKAVRRDPGSLTREEASAEFLRSKEDLDPATQKNYRLANENFGRWVSTRLGHGALLCDVFDLVEKEWMPYLLGLPGQAATKNALDGKLRVFLNFCERKEWLVTYPLLSPVPFNDLNKPSVKSWSHENVLGLLEMVIRRRPDLVATVATLVLIGLPLYIVVRLRLEHFKWEDALLVVPKDLTRQRSEWYIPLPSAFREWFRGRAETGPLCHLQEGGLKRALAVLRKEAGLAGGWKIELITAVSHWVAVGTRLEKALEVRGLSGTKDSARYRVKVSSSAGRQYINTGPPFGWTPRIPYVDTKEARDARPWQDVMIDEISLTAWEDYRNQAATPEST